MSNTDPGSSLGAGSWQVEPAGLQAWFWRAWCCSSVPRLTGPPLCFRQEKRRLAIRNAAQLWEGVRACLELPPTNGAKEDLSPESSPAHSPAQSNGLAQDPSPEEPR